jgi:hypothetical protein
MMLCGRRKTGLPLPWTEQLMRDEIHLLLRPRPLASLIAASVAGLATPSLAAPLCTPDLAITSTRLSEMRATQRTWTARIAVDASQCATTSGRFFLRFVRLKEIGPDLPFAEAFTWRPGEIEVATDFAADEAVLDVTIGYVRPCACRAVGAR